MPDTGGADDAEDRAGLEAIWGRAASAHASPVDRPAVPRAEVAASESPSSSPPVARRRRPGPVLGGVVLAIAAVAAVVVVVTGGEDDAGDPGGRGGATAPPPGGLGDPVWTLEVACPGSEPGVDGTTACPAAVDDGQAYVVLRSRGVTTLRALDLATGHTRWDVAFPEGARRVERLPSGVVVEDDGGTTVALDPATGDLLWRELGSLVGVVGRDRVLVTTQTRDAGGAGTGPTASHTVVAVATGRTVWQHEDVWGAVEVHPCPAADMVVVTDGTTVTAVSAVDGALRWSVPAPDDRGSAVHCDDDVVASVHRGELQTRDAATGQEVAWTPVGAADAEVPPQVLGVEEGIVVVGAVDGVRGFRTPTLDWVWDLGCRQCGPDLPVGSAGEGVVVLMGGDAMVPSVVEGREATVLDLGRRARRVLSDDTLVAWGVGQLLAVRTDDITHPRTAEVDDVRHAAVGPTHVVVTTRDEVRLYPFDP